MSLFKIYSSSAGSGKTYTLTKEFLKLVLSQEQKDYFKKILAITFTNDAAGEMKHRIVSALKEIASGENEQLTTQLLLEIGGIDKITLQKRAENAFQSVLQNYGELSVKTIDSFVNQIVKVFALDLSIPYNYEITFDAQLLLSQAVDSLLDKVGQENESDLTDVLLDFALDKVEEGKSWNGLADEIKKFGEVLLNEQGKLLISKNESLNLKDCKEILRKIKKYKSDTHKSVKDLAQKAFDMIESKGLTVEDFTRKKTGIYGFFSRLKAEPAALFTEKWPNSFHQDALYNDNWYGKNKSAATALIDEIKVDLREIGLQISAFRNDKYFILSHIQRNILKIPLLTRISTELDEIKAQKNEVFLSEFNQKILDVVVKEPIPFIYERLGEKFEHILIDEFQDTSNMQFYNLLPLIDNSISKNQRNLIVGDPKQSIYRWRGGNINLMLDLIFKNHENLKQNKETSEVQFFQIDNVVREAELENLAINYRSRKEIIEFNNQFFQFLVDSSQNDFPAIKSVFDGHHQGLSAKTKTGGHVEIRKYLEEQESLEIHVLGIVNEVLISGFSSGDICVLCRKKSESQEIADALKKAGFEVNSSDSLKLSSNLAVSFLISFLKVINQPQDLFLKFETLQFWALLFGKTDMVNQISDYHGFDYQSFIRFFNQQGIILDENLISNQDYYRTTEYLIGAFELLDSGLNQDYIFTFLDVLLSFFRRQSRLLIDFLDYFEEKKDSLSLNKSENNAITVTTIHKSKGLQYPVVLVPKANWDIRPMSSDKIWLDLESVEYEEIAVGGFRLFSAPFTSAIRKETDFGSAEFRIHDEMTFVENANLLYVALTRAVDRLYISYPERVRKSENGIDIFIDNFCRNFYPKETENNQIIISNGETYSQKISNLQNEEKYVAKLYPIDFYAENLKLKSSSEFKNLDNAGKIETGNLIHAAFELIKTKSDIEDAILRLTNAGLLPSDRSQEIKEKIVKIVNDPQLGFLFEGNQTVINEIEIVYQGEISRPDKVVIKGDKVYVVDYKTGEKHSKHLDQLAGYKFLLKKMGYENITPILIYLEPFEAIFLDGI